MRQLMIRLITVVGRLHSSLPRVDSSVCPVLGGLCLCAGSGCAGIVPVTLRLGGGAQVSFEACIDVLDTFTRSVNASVSISSRVCFNFF